MNASVAIVSLYSLLLTSIYFFIGYLALLTGSTDSISLYTMVAGFVILLPVIFGGIVYGINMFDGIFISTFKPDNVFVIIAILYFIYSAARQGDLTSGVVFFRNSAGFFLIFVFAVHMSRYMHIGGWNKSLYLLFAFAFFFAVMDLLLGYDFWRLYFPSNFIGEIKHAGVDENGVMGNKYNTFMGVRLYRISGAFFEPHHLGHFFAILSAFFFVNKKWFVFFASLLILLATFVKSSYLFFVLIVVYYNYLSRLRRRLDMNLILYSIVMVFILVKWLSLLFPHSTIGAHLQSSLLVFDLIDRPSDFLFGNSYGSTYDAGGNSLENFSVLASDSGLSSVILSSGFIGAIMFLILFKVILKLVDRARLQFKNSSVIFYESLVCSWFSMLPFASSHLSPVVSFFVFFPAGLIVLSSVRVIAPEQLRDSSKVLALRFLRM